jgi:thiol-disulfide isomerase/thioredoxin
MGLRFSAPNVGGAILFPMRKSFLSLGIALLAALSALPALAAPDLSGLWDAVAVAGPVVIPFRFEIAQNGIRARGFFFEGDRKVGSTSGSFQDGRLKLEYDFLDTVLEATLEGNQLRGTYRPRVPGSPSLEIHARRFTPAVAPASAAQVPQVAGSWDMRRVAAEAKEPSDTRTWNLYLRQSGAEISGSILRVDGDTGNLSGHWQDGKLVLSHFAGERPLLFEAKLNPDRTLSITLNREAHYLAVRKSEARAKGIPEPPDPSRYTSVKDPTAPFHFSFPDLGGKRVSDKDERFRGKVVLLAIGGSWCPNCLDEAPFLVELYKQFHAQGLEVVGLMFEADSDPALARPHVQSFIKRYGIPYTMLLAGTPEEIHQRLPQLVNFGAYPTTIYLGRDGRVRSVHAGFASPATGQEHIRLKNEARELVEKLLAENPPSGGNSRGL